MASADKGLEDVPEGKSLHLTVALPTLFARADRDGMLGPMRKGEGRKSPAAHRLAHTTAAILPAACALARLPDFPNLNTR